MNMILAMLLSDDGMSEADNCDWYFISLAVDVFVGVMLSFLLLKSIEAFAAYNGIDALNTGVYVREDYTNVESANLEPTQQLVGRSIDYSIYLLQLIVWSLIITIVKITLYFVCMATTEYLEIACDYLLGWTNLFPKFKLIFVMVLIPLVLNSIQFWIQDNILQGKKKRTL